MSSWIRLAANLRWLLASEALARAVGFVYVAATARLLGLEQFGVVTLALAYGEMLQFFASVSFPELLVRDGAPKPERVPDLLGRMLALQLLGALPVLGLGALLGLLYGEDLALPLLLASLLAWIRSLSQTCLAVAAAGEDLRPLSVAVVLERILNLAAVVPLFVVASTATVLLLGLLAGALVLLVFAAAVASRRGGFAGRSEPLFAGWRALLREGAAYSSLRWLGAITKRTDALILERMAGTEALGLYGAAFRLFDVFTVIPNLADRTLFPLLSKLRDASERVAGTVRRAVKGLAAVVLPATLASWFVAEPVFRVVYGEDYARGAPAWPILMTLLLASALGRPFLILLRAEGRIGRAIGITLGALAIRIAGSVALIALWHGDPRAPATAALAAEVFVLAALALACRPRAGSSLARTLRLLPAGAAMAFAAWALQGSLAWGAAVAGGLLYVLVLLFVYGLDPEERAGFRDLVGVSGGARRAR